VILNVRSNSSRPNPLPPPWGEFTPWELARPPHVAAVVKLPMCWSGVGEGVCISRVAVAGGVWLIQ